MNGYILLHGKHSGAEYAECTLALLNEYLKKDNLTDFSTWPWGVYLADDKFYHKPFEYTVEQIDSAINNLKSRGATKIVLVGHSMGANAILYYITQRRQTVDGVVLLAPAHNIHLPLFAKICRWSVERAKELVAAGKGNEEAYFVDYDSRGDVLVIPCTPTNYISMLDPTGSANMVLTSKKLDWPVNMLIISGDKDPTQTYFSDTIFQNLKDKSDKLKYEVVPGDHSSVCWDYFDKITIWVNSL